MTGIHKARVMKGLTTDKEFMFQVLSILKLEFDPTDNSFHQLKSILIDIECIRDVHRGKIRQTLEHQSISDNLVLGSVHAARPGINC